MSLHNISLYLEAFYIDLLNGHKDWMILLAFNSERQIKNNGLGAHSEEFSNPK